jgi:hypothetical protein
MHNASLIQMGSTRSNVREVDNHAGDPATFKAGLCVHLKSDDTLSLAVSDGSKLGISLGRSLSNTKRVPIVRKGLGVPILLTAAFEPDIGAQVHISDTTGKAGAAGAGFTATNAVYASEKMSAQDEDGVAITDGAAYIDFQGGL